MTPFTLRPVPRAVLDWLAIAGAVGGVLGFAASAVLALISPSRFLVWFAAAVICMVSAVLGTSWLTDWKHRASARREEELKRVRG